MIKVLNGLCFGFLLMLCSCFPTVPLRFSEQPDAGLVETNSKKKFKNPNNGRVLELAYVKKIDEKIYANSPEKYLDGSFNSMWNSSLKMYLSPGVHYLIVSNMFNSKEKKYNWQMSAADPLFSHYDIIKADDHFITINIEPGGDYFLGRSSRNGSIFDVSSWETVLYNKLTNQAEPIVERVLP